MTSCESCSSSSQVNALVLRGVDLRVLGMVLQQQRREGLAAAQLIDDAGVAPQGAPEPGKGTVVDVVA
ncbi:MAG: hypothetical protein ABIP94_14540 [Planctomycetota bacterium]